MRSKKIPYKRFGYERCMVDGNYFKEIAEVSVDDIRALTQHELNSIPLSWLYDWSEVHGVLILSEVRDWLDAQRQIRMRPHVLQLPQGKNQVVFKGIAGDNRIYTANYKDYYLSGGRIVCGGKHFAPSPEQIKRLNIMFRTFLNEYEKAKALDGFECVDFDDNKLYYRRLSDYRYQFISCYKDGEILQKVCEIRNFLSDFDFFEMNKKQSFGISDKIKQSVEDGSFPLLQSADKYLVCEIKYQCDCAKKEEVIFLNDTDGKGRFVQEKTLFGCEDFEVIALSFRYKRYSRHIESIEVDGKIDGKSVFAIWKFGDTINIIANYKAHTVWITPGLQQQLFTYFEAARNKSRK
ncbi:MAG: hypothetical protein J1F69_01630 [Clostridiales bacterium]|nr:hypothetical protein [Clostridiales bacterium]